MGANALTLKYFPGFFSAQMRAPCPPMLHFIRKLKQDNNYLHKEMEQFNTMVTSRVFFAVFNFTTTRIARVQEKAILKQIN